MNGFCGLDFGTSNSTIGLWNGNAPHLVEFEGTGVSTPSAIFFDFSNGQPSFGKQAVSDYVAGVDGRFMRALKSILGTSLIDEKTAIARKAVSFQEIIGLYFGNLKDQAERNAGIEIRDVVLGRPVFFVDGDPEADAKSQQTLETLATQVGFTNVSFQYEPVAAAMDYESRVTEEKLALIVDIGGGTSDFSIVRVSPERRARTDRADDVLANTGVHVGGTDFDRLLSVRDIMPMLGLGSTMTDTFGEKILDLPQAIFYELATWQKINFLYKHSVFLEIKSILRLSHNKDLVRRLLHVIEEQYGHKLAMEIEDAKIALTDADICHIDLDFIEDGLNQSMTVDGLNQSMSGHVDKLKRAANEAFATAGLSGDQIDTVFLTGGSTAIPFVRSELLALTPQADIIEGDRFGSVGIGLTLEANRRYG